MKRPSSSGSLAGAGGLIPICSPEEKRAFGRVGSLQSILDGLGEEEEEEMMMMGEDGSGVGLSLSSREKKRRLTVEQVKALEKNFEVENKLEPERKVKLAQELGLQPRQVAVWFQNRRARWKTKQLERDYGVLKSNYDALRSNYDALVHDKESLLAEIKELKAKLAGDGESSYCSIKEEPVVQEEELELTHQKKKIKTTTTTTTADGDKVEEEDEDVPPLIYKDGSSDSDSSAILNDFSSAPGVISHQNQLLDEFMGFNCTSSSTSSPFQYPDGRGGRFSCHYYQQQEQQQQMILKMEESEFEPCSSNFFSDEQPPSMPWYCPDQWD